MSHVKCAYCGSWWEWVPKCDSCGATLTPPRLGSFIAVPSTWHPVASGVLAFPMESMHLDNIQKEIRHVWNIGT